MIAEERGYTQIADMLRHAMVKTERTAHFPIDFTPPEFLCPITCDLFKDPVILGTTGHTFEREAITEWLRLNNTDPLTNNPLISTTLSPNYSLLEAVNRYVRTISGRVITSSELVLGEPLGAGSDKEAFQALYKGNPVVVLRLRQAAGTDAEAQMFVRLGFHPHLVRFLGRANVSFVDGVYRVVDNLTDIPNALVTEMAAHGDLASYLGRLSDAGIVLPLRHCLLISEQIADGMAAIHAAGIIHRDLAARNVMVFGIDIDDVSKTLVKVSDYGISVQGGGAGYLRTSGNTVVPVRYMPPEAIRRRAWSNESDIWSFGVVMWEIFSNGDYPYGDVPSDETVAARVREGTLRLTRPPSCPESVWMLIENCWAVDRSKRPSFTQLKIHIKELRKIFMDRSP